MKCRTLWLILILLLLLPGCWVFSINPLYEDADTSRAFDRSLTGNWWEPNGGCLLTLTPEGEPYPSTYHVEYAAPAERKDADCLVDAGKKVEFEGRVVNLGEHRFLDLAPLDKDICFQCLPLHSIYMVSLDKDTLSLVPMDYDWLRSALQEKRLNLSTSEDVESSESGDPITLTVSTKDLRNLAGKYADDHDVFKPGPTYSFQRR